MFNRRLTIFFLFVVLIFAVIIVRLVGLQVLAHQEYLSKVEDVMLRPPVLLPSIRGEIFDRHGHLLARNIPCFSLGIHYGAISLDEAYLDRLARSRALRRLARRPKKEELKLYVQQIRQEIEQMWQEDLPGLLCPPVQTIEKHSELLDNCCQMLKDRRQEIVEKVTLIRGRVKTSLRKRKDQLQDNWLGTAQAEAISQQITSLVLREELSFFPIVSDLENNIARHIQDRLGSPEWLTLIPATRRVYPYGYVAAQTIGSVGTVLWDHPLYLEHHIYNPDDPQNRDPLRGYAPQGDIMGHSGTELGYDWQILRGTRGLQQKDRSGNLVSSASVEPQKGKDLHLTIDIELQYDLEKIMPTDSPAAAVVIHVPTAQVLALVSTPLLHRNGSNSITEQRQSPDPELFLGPNPWMNRAVEAGYQPGSTVKPVVILAGLSENDPDTGLRVISPQTIFHCPTNKFLIPKCHSYHGSVDPYDAIRRSCNVYCANVAVDLGASLPIWYSNFGLVRWTPLSLPRENPGVLPGFLSNRPGVLPRLLADLARQLGIGQGTLAVSPLQVANMMATFARRGFYVPPTLNLAQDRSNQAVQLDFDPRAMDLVLRAMRAVVHEGGTAGGVSGLRSLGFRIAAKTGTAEYQPDLEDYRCWFSGFAPADDPQLAFSVVIEHGKTGADAAGPVAAELLRLCAEHGYIKTASSADLSLQIDRSTR